MSEFNIPSQAGTLSTIPHVQPGSEFPDYCEPIRAWRFWRLTPQGDLLQSFIDSKWTPYEPFVATHVGDAKGTLSYRVLLSAVDRNGPPPECTSVPCSYHKPGYVYGCGVYGLKSQQRFQDKMKAEFEEYDHLLNLATTVRLFGSVWLWGRIWEHEHGYRAQYAYPASFTYGYNCDAAKLASIYGIPYNEDTSWKSVFQSVTSSQNLYDYPFLSARLQSLPKSSFQLQFLSTPRSKPLFPLRSSSPRNWANLLYSPKMRAWYDKDSGKVVTDAEMENAKSSATAFRKAWYDEKEEYKKQTQGVWFDQKDESQPFTFKTGWDDPSDDKPPTKD